MFTVKQMRYFDALATHLHFRKAAETVFVSQPALSAQIAEMENLAGSPLFERANKSVLLTELGHTLWPRIKVILQEIRALEELTEQKSGILQSRLRLGIIPTIAPYLLPDLIQALKQQYPALTLELREALTDKLLEELRNGELDVVIAAMPVHDPYLTGKHLFDDRFSLLLPAIIMMSCPRRSHRAMRHWKNCSYLKKAIVCAIRHLRSALCRVSAHW